MLKYLSYFLVLSVVFEYALGLYFHISETERKCFIEEIPDETSILGINYHLDAYLCHLS